MPDPIVSFANPAVVPVDAGNQITETNWYPLGKATVKLVLDNNAQEDFTVTLSGTSLVKPFQVFGNPFEITFKKGSKNAEKIFDLQLSAPNTLPTLKVTAKNGQTATTSVGVRNPKLSFALDPFETGLKKENNICVFAPGDTVKLKVVLDYKAPAKVEGSISGDIISAKTFSISQGGKETQVEVKLPDGDRFNGEYTLNLQATTGCLIGDSATAKIKIIPPLTINFFEGNNWIEPCANIFCQGDEAKIKVILNGKAPKTAKYGKIQVGSKVYEIEIPQGQQEGSVTVNFPDLGDKKITLTGITAQGDAEDEWVDVDTTLTGSNNSKTLKINPKNQVGLVSPTEKGPFFLDDVVNLKVTLRDPATTDGVVVKLTSNLFKAPYDVSFKTGQKELVIPATIANEHLDSTGNNFIKKGIIKLELANSKYLLDAQNKQIELALQHAIEYSFKSDKPNPPGPFCIGDEFKLTVVLARPLSDSRFVGSESLSVGQIGFATCRVSASIYFLKGQKEKEILFKIVKEIPNSWDTRIDQYLEVGDITSAQEFTGLLESLFTRDYTVKSGADKVKFKVKPYPEISFHSSPFSQGGSKLGHIGSTRIEDYVASNSDIYKFKNGDAFQLRVNINDDPPQEGSTFTVDCLSFVGGKINGKFTNKEPVYISGQWNCGDLGANSIRCQLIKLEASERCWLKESKVNYSKAHTTAVGIETFNGLCFPAEDDWISPGPYHDKDRVKIKFLLLGLVQGNATVKLKGDAFATPPASFSISTTEWSKWTGYQKPKYSDEFEVQLNVKKSLLGSSEGSYTITIDDSTNCAVGDLKSKTISVKPAITAFIGKLNHFGPFCQGDKFKLTVELTFPARTGQESVEVSAQDNDGVVFPEKTPALNKITVNFEKGAKTAETEIEIVKPADPARYLTAEKKIEIKLIEVPDSGIYVTKDYSYKIPLRPFPKMYFDSNTPIKLRAKTREGFFRFRVTQKPVVFVKLTDKPPLSGVKAIVSGNALGSGKTYEANFAPEKNEDGKYTPGEVEKEVPVELVEETTGPSEDIELSVTEGAMLRQEPNDNKIKICVADGAFNFTDDWISPKKEVYAVGDRVFIRVKRTIKDLSGKTEAAITSSAFYKSDGDKTLRNYIAAFKENNDTSEPIEVPEGNHSRPSDGKGILLWNGNDDHPQYFSILPVTPGSEQYGRGDEYERTLLVKNVRHLYFDPTLYDEDIELVFMSKLKLTINLSVPAFKDTEFYMTGPFLRKRYLCKIPENGETCSREITFDSRGYSEDMLNGEGEVNLFLEVKTKEGEHDETNVTVKPEDPGMLAKLKQRFGTLPYSGKLKVKVLTPLVAFKNDAPIQSPFSPGAKNTAAFLGMGAKVTLNFVLSQPPPAGAEAEVVSPAFGPKKYPLIFEAEETSKSIEVTVASAKHEFTGIVVIGKKHCASDMRGEKAGVKEDQTLPDSIIQVQISHLPALLFSNAQGDWIDPIDFPFVLNDKAKITVSLGRPALAGKAAKGLLLCDAFANAYSFEIPPGERSKELEVAFAKLPEYPNQTIQLEAVENCVLSTEYTRTVMVYKQRSVYFPLRGAIEPLGCFIEGDKAHVTVLLDLPAPKSGAKATLSGPFASNVEVNFDPGSLLKKVEVTFTREAKDNQTIELSQGSNTKLGTNVKTSVLVYKPKVSFAPKVNTANPQVINPEAAPPGGKVWLMLELDSPAPVNGCSIHLNSDAFLAIDGYRLNFPPGVRYAGLDVILNNICSNGGTAQITMSGEDRCALGSATSMPLTIRPFPSIKFSRRLEKNRTFEEGETVDLCIAPEKAPANALNVKITSKAFGPMIYNVTLPAGKMNPVIQKVTFQRGLPPGNDAKILGQAIRLIAPSGWQANTTPDVAGKEEPNASVLVVQVAIPEDATSTTSCPYDEARYTPRASDDSFPDPDNEDEVKMEPEFDLANPCTLHRLVITVDHGKSLEGVNQQRKFDLVRDQSMAKRPNPLVCTPHSVPILQVIGGREFGDPHVPENEAKTSFHYTTISVETDPRDKYCNQMFLFGDEETVASPLGNELSKTPDLIENDKRQHPMIFVRERVKGSMSWAEMQAYRMQDRKDTVVQGVLEPLDLKAEGKKMMVKAKTDAIQAAQAKADPWIKKAMQKKDEMLGVEEFETAPVEPAQQEESETRERRSWKGRYEWHNIIPEPRNVRQNIDVNKGNKGVLFKFPVFQADQLWHEYVEKEVGEVGVPIEVKMLSTDEMKKDADGEDKQEGMGMIRDLMSALSFALMKPRQYHLVVESCGVPITDTDTPAPPCEKLQAVIEVYPSDEFCLHYHYKPNLPNLKFGSEGKFYDPKKKGDAGIKSQAGVAFAENFTPDEDDKEGDDKEVKLVDPEMDEGGGKGFRKIDEDPRMGRAASFLDAELMESIPKEAKATEEPGSEHSPSLVFHSIRSMKEEKDKEKRAKLVEKGQVGLIAKPPDEKSTAKAGINLDALVDDNISTTQDFIDKNFFSLTDMGLELTRNGKSGPFYYQITKTIGASIQTINAIANVFTGMSQAVATVMSPFGWGIDFSLSFLEGDLSVFWGWKEHTDSRVFPWYSIQLNLNLVTVKVEVYFGFKLSVKFAKFEALIYGNISLSATLDSAFERTSPDTVTPEWLDTWIGVLGTAALGARVVLISDSVLRIDAMVKSGYELKFRIATGLADRFGVEYMIFWTGIAAEANFKVAGAIDVKKTVSIVEGNPKELPWKRGAFPRRASNSWWNTKKAVNLAWSRMLYQRSLVLDRLVAYQELQIKMIGARKKTKPTSDWKPYKGGTIGYRFEGNASDNDGLRDYQDRKELFERQWTECVDAFRLETEQSFLASYNLGGNLKITVQSKIEPLLKSEIIPRLTRLDALKEKLRDLNERVAMAEDEADEGAAPDPKLLEEAEALLADEDLNIRESIFKKPLRDFDSHLEDLHNSAVCRKKW